jgi:hypothetical protein
MAKAYGEARQQHGQSQLLDEIVAAKPEVDHTRYGSMDELKTHLVAHLRDAIALLSGKATSQEVQEYKGFILTLANRVASAHREGGGQDPVSEAERGAIEEIVNALG